jgi:cytoskeletal protein RodZ
MDDRIAYLTRLRRERERRGLTLEHLARRTNVSAAMWASFEDNDFTRWPSGVFARAFVREYAQAVGLEPEETVDEFCRMFPQGDRRAERTLRARRAHRPRVAVA